MTIWAVRTSIGGAWSYIRRPDLANHLSPRQKDAWCHRDKAMVERAAEAFRQNVPNQQFEVVELWEKKQCASQDGIG